MGMEGWRPFPVMELLVVEMIRAASVICRRRMRVMQDKRKVSSSEVIEVSL